MGREREITPYREHRYVSKLGNGGAACEYHDPLTCVAIVELGPIGMTMSSISMVGYGTTGTMTGQKSRPRGSRSRRKFWETHQEENVLLASSVKVSKDTELTQQKIRRGLFLVG